MMLHIGEVWHQTETEAINSARKSWGKFKGNTMKEEYDFFRGGRKGMLTWEEAVH